MALQVGFIAIWSGTLANIPANWNLCDGNGGTPNLVAKFLRGAPAATEPGTTGGADNHGHASMTTAGAHTHSLENFGHYHTYNSAGDHDHKGLIYSDVDYTIPDYDAMDGLYDNAGDHAHDVSTEYHSHTLASSGGHQHTINTADGRPPFYEVAYIQAGVGATIEDGIIIIWSGTIATIPTGWELCDGGNSRPDLRAKFTRGINTSVTEPGTTGGSMTHLHVLDNCASHNHSSTTAGVHYHGFSFFTWTHNHNTGFFFTEGDVAVVYQSDSGAGDHCHSDTDSVGAHNHDTIGQGGVHTHTVNTASSLPQYKDIAYIYCDGAVSIPVDGIVIWTGLIANIPSGWELCDGVGGRPDYRTYFVRGAATGVNPGGTGGSDTHGHTDQDAGIHADHTQTDAGGHQHGDSSSEGAHTHSTSAPDVARYGIVPVLYSQVEDGAHTHSVESLGNHWDHTVSNSASHNHQPYSQDDDGRPAYYEVLFIIRKVVGPFPTHFRV